MPRSCSTFVTGDESKAGLPTRIASERARDTATLSRLRLATKWTPRGASSADDVVSDR